MVLQHHLFSHGETDQVIKRPLNKSLETFSIKPPTTSGTSRVPPSHQVRPLIKGSHSITSVTQTVELDSTLSHKHKPQINLTVVLSQVRVIAQKNIFLERSIQDLFKYFIY